MCRPKSEGGARCAAHTRPAFAKVASLLNGLGPDDTGEDTAVTDAELEMAREHVRAAGFNAFADHASTVSGRDEVDQFLHEHQFTPYPDQNRDQMCAWIRSAMAEGDKRRAISKDVEARLKGEAVRAGKVRPAPEAEEPDMATLAAGWERAVAVLASDEDYPNVDAHLSEVRPAVNAFAATKIGQATIQRFWEERGANMHTALTPDSNAMLRTALTDGEQVRRSRQTVSERLGEERAAEDEARAREGSISRFAELEAALPIAPAQPAPPAQRGLFARIADIGLAGEVGPVAPRLLGRFGRKGKG